MSGYLAHGVLTRDDVVEALGDAPLNNKEMFQLLSIDHWEVWEGGLPPKHKFEAAESSGGLPTLRAKGKELYIWVVPEAYYAIQRDPHTLLMAYGNRAGTAVNFGTVCLPTLPLRRTEREDGDQPISNETEATQMAREAIKKHYAREFVINHCHQMNIKAIRNSRTGQFFKRCWSMDDQSRRPMTTKKW